MYHNTNVVIEDISNKIDYNRFYDNYMRVSEIYYPDLKKWFVTKVIPDLGWTRRIFVCKIDDRIQTIAIVKNKDKERKICFFKALAGYQQCTELLFQYCFKWLETDKPLFTVSEDLKPYFDKYIEKYGFKQTQVIKNFYKPNRLEYVYNGHIQKDVMKVIDISNNLGINMFNIQDFMNDVLKNYNKIEASVYKIVSPKYGSGINIFKEELKTILTKPVFELDEMNKLITISQDTQSQAFKLDMVVKVTNIEFAEKFCKIEFEEDYVLNIKYEG